MKLKEHFGQQFDGLFLKFKSLTVGLDGKLKLRTVGCGCCSKEKSVNENDLKDAIYQTEHLLRHLKELKLRMGKNEPLPRVKVDD